jgi:DNA-binding beta-propeller fold protein YncE
VAHLEAGGISGIDRVTGAVRTVETEPGAIGVDVSPDGERIWITNVQANSVAVIDAKAWRLETSFASRGEGPVRVKLTPDGKTAVVVNRATRNLTLFDAATRAFAGSIALPVEPKVLALSPDGRRAALTSPASDRAVVVDLRARRVVAEIPTGRTPDGSAWAGPAVPYRSQVAFTIPEPDLVPEGIAHDPASGDFFVSSTYRRKIVRVDRSGKVTDFTSEAQDGLLGVVGMKVDSKRRLLWALCGDAGADMPMRNMESASEGRSGAFVFDLRTGKLAKKFMLGGPAEKHFLNDLVLDARGAAYATDSVTGAVYQLSLERDEPRFFLEPGRLPWPNGIALADDGGRMFVATRDGFAAVDMRTKAVTPIAMPDGERARADGLYYFRGSLVAVQSWNTGRVVARYVLGRSHDRVERVEVVEGNHPAFLQPSTGVVVGDAFYYVANSQLQHFRKLWSSNPSVPAEKLRHVVVLRARL